MVSCRECGAAQLVYDDVGSLVCTNCGTLVDPEQAVLAQHDDHASTPSYSVLRTRSGWNLASQTKQDRDRKNTIAMSTFINSVLSRLNNPGLSPRAEAIFTQAMSMGNYRWGRKAKLTAGASIAIALREAHKSDSLRDIAFLLDESPVSVSRTFQSVVSLLNFSLTSTDPAVHLPILHAHLQSLIHPETLSPPPPSQLPKPLVSILTPLSLQTAIRTATSLSQIISQHSPPLPIIDLPTPPTACALFILGLEAEIRAPLPHLGDLARTLGTRFALASGVVSSRYKILYDLIEEWIRHVPWLDQFVYKGKGRGASARSKVPKRTIVAKGIKDVIQFHEEIWLSRMQKQQKIKLDLQPDPGENALEGEEEDGGEDHGSVTTPTVASSSTNVREPDMTPPPSKKRKVEKKRGAMYEAYRFLLDPLSASMSPKGASTTPTANGEVSLLTHILTCPSNELSRGAPPTRLQLLAASRGGSTSENIADEELFAEGELEGMLRSEQEREALRPLFQLNWGDDATAKEAPMHRPKPPIPTEPKRGAKRINMDALARLLGGDIDVDEADEEEVGFPDSDNADYLWGWGDFGSDPSRHRSPTEGAELVSDWRPASSDDDNGDENGNYRNTVEDRYEEEL